MKHAVHRLWRLLPREARRRLFVHATSLMVPDRGACSNRLPVIIAGVLSSATGLGESARMNVDGARRAGLPYATVDLSGSLLAEADLPRFPQEGEVSPIGPGTLVLHTPGSTLPYALVRCGREAVWGKWLIGFWHWELAELPDDWRFGCSRLDEVWVPSQFCADAVRKSFAGPIRIIRHPVDVAGMSHIERDDGKFTALTIFNMASGFERKNPLAAIRAFKEAFGEDPQARLIVKVVNPDHYPEGMTAMRAEVAGAGNIEFIDRVMARQDVMELIARADAVLSLHRSEGFGMLAAEAMLIGTPIIATDWSATTEFVTEETGVPIPYRLIPANDPQGCAHFPDQQWADADVPAAAEALRRLRADPALAARLAAAGKAKAEGLFSVDKYAEQMREALVGDMH